MAKNHMIRLQGRDFITYPGLMEKAHALGLAAIRTRIAQFPHADNGNTTIVEATVILRDPETGLEREFSGIGDANPGNVNRNIAPHCIRMAETRAKARALRDATGTEETSYEELSDYDMAPADERRAEPARPQTTAKPEPIKQAKAPQGAAPQDLATKAQIDEAGKEMKRTGFTPEQGRAYLMQHFGKGSRLELSQEEIGKFVAHLKGLPPAEEDDPMVKAVREAEQADKGAA